MRLSNYGAQADRPSAAVQVAGDAPSKEVHTRKIIGRQFIPTTTSGHRSTKK